MTKRRHITADAIRFDLTRMVKDAISARGNAGDPIRLPGLGDFAHRLSLEAANSLFEPLFVVATNMIPPDGGLGYGADDLAARLLVALEPRCPLSCDDAVRLLEAGRWQVSDHLVPLYLTIQFGKSVVEESALRVARESRARGGDGRCDTVAYHLGFCTFRLAGDGLVLL